MVCLALPLSIIGSNFIEERQKIIDAEAAATLLAEKNGSAGEVPHAQIGAVMVTELVEHSTLAARTKGSRTL